MDFELVTSLRDVIVNVGQFNMDLQESTDIVSQLTQFKHWYYIPTRDLFGPSKFIGYKNMNTSRYARGRSKTGIDTEAVLNEWFVKLPIDSVRSIELMDKLNVVFDLHQMKIRSNAFIHVLKNGINVPS